MSGKRVVRIKEIRVKIEMPTPSDALGLLCWLHGFIKEHSDAYYIKRINSITFDCGDVEVTGLDADIQANGYKLSVASSCDKLVVAVASSDPRIAMDVANKLASFLATKMNARLVGAASGSSGGSSSGGNDGTSVDLVEEEDDDDDEFLDDEDECYV